MPTNHNFIKLTIAEREALRELGLSTLRGLSTPEGVLASGRSEAYGCIFGRDSLIIALKLLAAYERTPDAEALGIARTILMGIVKLQGKALVPESGEEPGKCIHEWRPTDHERLSQANPPWYVYPDGQLRNYEGVDETALLLWTMGRYLELVHDAGDREHFIPHAKAAYEWILNYGDSNGDGFTDFAPRTDWTYGGLTVQSWMDSHDSVFHEDGTELTWPVAPVEVQAYTYAAFRTWSKLLEEDDVEWSAELASKARELKTRFNAAFMLENGDVLANAIDGSGRQVRTVRSCQGHVLFAGVLQNGNFDCILEEAAIPPLVARLMEDDLFDPLGGIRTLSSRSPRYDAQSYHNGPIWPHDAGMIAEGFEKAGYGHEAALVREAVGSALHKLQSPYEYYTMIDGEPKPGFEENGGHGSCKVQGWTAATLYAEMSMPAPASEPEPEPMAAN